MARKRPAPVDGLLVVDKPAGLTSHDVVAQVRRALGTSQVGHAGTLDPAATGVLVLGVGQATKLLGRVTLDDKRYDARICLGAQTDTDDAEGAVVRRGPVPERLADPAVADVLVRSLEGPSLQVPPCFSAISVNGHRAYDRARQGEAVELEPRPVTVKEARLLSVAHEPQGLVWDCSFWVSKGCYIRALARDLGNDLGCGAHLCGLRRTASGCLDIQQAVALEDLERDGVAAAQAALADPTRVLGVPVQVVSPEELAAARNGQRLQARAGAEGELVGLVQGDRLFGLWRRRGPLLSCDLNLVKGVQGVRGV